MQKRLQRSEALCREVVVAVAGEAEVDQFPERFFQRMVHKEKTSLNFQVGVQFADMGLVQRSVMFEIDPFVISVFCVQKTVSRFR